MEDRRALHHRVVDVEEGGRGQVRRRGREPRSVRPPRQRQRPPHRPGRPGRGPSRRRAHSTTPRCLRPRDDPALLLPPVPPPRPRTWRQPNVAARRGRVPLRLRTTAGPARSAAGRRGGVAAARLSGVQAEHQPGRAGRQPSFTPGRPGATEGTFTGSGSTGSDTSPPGVPRRHRRRTPPEPPDPPEPSRRRCRSSPSSESSDEEDCSSSADGVSSSAVSSAGPAPPRVVVRIPVGPGTVASGTSVCPVSVSPSVGLAVGHRRARSGGRVARRLLQRVRLAEQPVEQRERLVRPCPGQDRRPHARQPRGLLGGPLPDVVDLRGVGCGPGEQQARTLVRVAVELLHRRAHELLLGRVRRGVARPLGLVAGHQALDLVEPALGLLQVAPGLGLLAEGQRVAGRLRNPLDPVHRVAGQRVPAGERPRPARATSAAAAGRTTRRRGPAVAATLGPGSGAGAGRPSAEVGLDLGFVRPAPRGTRAAHLRGRGTRRWPARRGAHRGAAPRGRPSVGWAPGSGPCRRRVRRRGSSANAAMSRCFARALAAVPAKAGPAERSSAAISSSRARPSLPSSPTDGVPHSIAAANRSSSPRPAGMLAVLTASLCIVWSLRVPDVHPPNDPGGPGIRGKDRSPHRVAHSPLL